jgi:hypothetical protein
MPTVKLPINKNVMSHLDKFIVAYRVGENVFQAVETLHQYKGRVGKGCSTNT